MLHVRVVSPAETTGRLAGALAAEVGVHNLTVLPGAVRGAGHDAVSFDVRRGAANPVFRLLRELRLDQPGAVTVARVETVLGGPPRPAGEVGSPRREITPVWELVDATIRENAVYAPSFFILLAIAGMIAAIGLLTSSQILIVGAMVVGPEYSAIIAVALAISRREWRDTHDGLIALTAGFLAAIAVTFLFTLLLRSSARVPHSFQDGVSPVANLIATPGVLSFAVAVLAGVAGVVSLTESRANALIGVFISITTVPAAAGAGVFSAFGDWRQALGSLAQLLLNVVVLTVVGALALRGQRYLWRRRITRPADRE